MMDTHIAKVSKQNKPVPTNVICSWRKRFADVKNMCEKSYQQYPLHAAV